MGDRKSAEIEGNADMWTNGRRLAAVIAVSLFALLCAASGTQAATYSPGSFADDLPVEPGDCDDGGPDCSLREAVEKANSTSEDDVVRLAAGRYVITGNEGDDIRIDPRDAGGSLAVEGEGARATIVEVDALFGEVFSRAFTFAPRADGELADLAITGGTGQHDQGVDDFDGGAVALEDLNGGGGDAEALLLRVRLFGNRVTADGGAVKNRGKLTIAESLIDGNSAGGSGGGIENDDELSIENSTISNNAAGAGAGAGAGEAEGKGLSEQPNDGDGNGGGIDSDGNHSDDEPQSEMNFEALVDSDEGKAEWPGGAVTLVHNSTIAHNEAVGVGGGISSAIPEIGAAFTHFAEPVAWFHNSVVSENTASEEANCSGNGAGDEGPFASSYGHNIERGTSCLFSADGDKNADPELGELADNGGDTDTHALPEGSPAIDAGNDEFCPGIDQRGEARPVGDHCDMGAYEAPAEDEPEEPEQPQQPGGPATPLPQPQVPQARDPRCRDRQPPLTRLTRRGLRINSKGVHLRGTSRDRPRGCASGVHRVEVSLARVSGTGLNCRFQRLTNHFLLTPFQNCRRPVRFVANGQNRWRFTYKLRLPPGKYRAQARGWDNVDNKETPKKRRNIIHFVVK